MNNQPNQLLEKFLESINHPKLTEEQKQAVLSKAHNARSEQEMHQIVDSLAAQ